MCQTVSIACPEICVNFGLDIVQHLRIALDLNDQRSCIVTKVQLKSLGARAYVWIIELQHAINLGKPCLRVPESPCGELLEYVNAMEMLGPKLFFACRPVFRNTFSEPPIDGRALISLQNPPTPLSYAAFTLPY